jgi:hypothetical protein
MKFLIHSPYDTPISYEANKYVTFYQEFDVEDLIIPEIVRSDESFRSYPLERRNCYFEDEQQLKYLMDNKLTIIVKISIIYI